ncbi:hypothetical protein [Nocardioides daejeonensis]|uniref:hypothetical protein n=1 Tax=Nocardioides daejeonensis TaxID=1046556 RepID=UPI000D746B10|nr:hypothetical protein [Nocardioides daejeonensis]
MRCRVALVLTTICLATLLPPPAVADPPPDPPVVGGGQLAGEVAVRDTPDVLDGRVESVTRAGDTMVLGGDFRRVRDHVTGRVLRRRNLVAFDAATGRVLPAFAPVVDGPVSTVLAAGDGQTVYIAGDFRTVSGVRRQNLARLRVEDGGVVRSFDAGAITGQVRDLALVRDRLWVAGAFTHVAGRARRALATVDPGTGRLTAEMGLRIAGTHHGGVTQVLALDARDDQVALVGNFTTVEGASRRQLAVLDVAGTHARLSGFRTDFYAAQCSSANTTYLRDVAFAPSGEWLVAVTTGGAEGPDSPCDSAARFEVAGGTRAPTWVAATGGDTMTAAVVTDAAVYVGGHFRWLNNPWGRNRAGSGAVPRSGIAALDPLNGLPLPWNPGRTRGVGVFDLLPTPDGLWVASDTDRINWQLRGRIARMRPTGRTIRQVGQPTLPADVVGSGAPGFRRTVGADAAGELTTGPTFTGMRAGFVLDGEVFHVDVDAPVLRRSPWQGDGLGAAEPATAADGTVPLSQWRDELRRITGLVYDAGRVYYTLAGDPRLWTRAFSPAGGVVGARRAVADLGGEGAPYATMRGMFLAGEHLHWLDASGRQWSAPWRRTASSARPDLAAAQVLPGATVPASEGAVQLVLQEGVGAGPWPDVTGAAPYTLHPVGRPLTVRRAHTKRLRVRVPASARPGDLVLLHAAGAGKPRLVAPAGWRRAAAVRTPQLAVGLWSHRLATGEVGGRIAVTTSRRRALRLTLVVLRSADGDLRVQARHSTTSGGRRGTRAPTPVAGYGSWVLRFVATAGGPKVRWGRPDRLLSRRLAQTANPGVQVLDTAAPVAAGRYRLPKARVRGVERTVDLAVVVGR